jgi:hypothetical protein
MKVISRWRRRASALPRNCDAGDREPDLERRVRRSRIAFRLPVNKPRRTLAADSGMLDSTIAVPTANSG